MKFSAPRGTKDILPEEAAAWRQLEEAFRRQCGLYGFSEIRTPIFEEAELYLRSTGEETEIVTKQMYLFSDLGGRKLALRPEGTPGVVRAYLQSGLADKGGVSRLFYVGPFFRYERPQAGRFRQFHQAGVEVFGSDSPQVDAEVIALMMDFLKALGLEGAKLKINSTGCKQCRPVYQQALRDALAPVVNDLCEWCQERYKGNTLRILDEKRPECRKLFGNLPSILDHLDEGCKAHFEGVLKQLDLLGIAYEVDANIVRGLDYYTRTVFEVSHSALGAQDALGGGGRYDDLVEQFGGKPTPAVGWAGGVERILTAALANEATVFKTQAPLYLALAGEDAAGIVPRLLKELRAAGLAVVNDPLGRSLKAQMKEASRLGSPWVIMLGEEEIASGAVTLRNMASGEQQKINQTELITVLTRLMEQPSP
jgi:histidyl-tRNA synthetase